MGGDDKVANPINTLNVRSLHLLKYNQDSLHNENDRNWKGVTFTLFISHVLMANSCKISSDSFAQATKDLYLQAGIIS